MGRIDDALRRAGAPTRGSSGGAPSDDVFVSPWAPDYHDSARRAVTAPSEALRPEPLRIDAPPSLQEVRAEPIERIATEWQERLIASQNAHPGLAESFRRLAAALLNAQRSAPIKSVMITSAAPSDGKTITALNLALVLSESYRRRVLLIDADLRRPTMSETLGLAAASGLTNVLKAGDGQPPHSSSSPRS